MLKAAVFSLNGEEGPHIATLRDAGFELTFKSAESDLWNEDHLIAEMEGVSAVIAGSEPYTSRVIENCPELRIVARSGVGFDAVDLEACNGKAILVTTTPGVNHHAVAEHTISLLMGIARDFPKQDQHVRSGSWIRRAFPRVMGTTLGIVGLGRIGQAVATRARGLGMNVVAFDPYANKEFAAEWQVELVSLDDLYARSEYVSLHSPSTPETFQMINKESLAKMKPGSVLINTARGSLIKEDDLIESLKSGHLRGAGLDVYEVEPLPMSSQLLELDNVLLSGHTAGLDIESHNGMFGMCGEIIVALHKGEWPAAECVQNLPGVTDWKW
ncbi:MAG: phosphoglycerate dehydrogenase [Planctomycetales bacterium]|jgi:D-3-phosphoglycerate dehydrogenase